MIGLICLIVIAAALIGYGYAAWKEGGDYPDEWRDE